MMCVELPSQREAAAECGGRAGSLARQRGGD
jgi:hypothetical protein